MTDRITFAIFSVLVFQQAPVFNVGIPLKIYDLISVCCLIMAVTYFHKYKIYKANMLLFILFLICPLPGLVLTALNSDLQDYYIKFPDALSNIRFDNHFSGLITYAYCVFLCSTCLVISNLKSNNNNFKKTLKFFIVSTTITCLYCLYSLILVSYLNFPDLIPAALDARNSRPDTQWRPAGFTAEPGFLSFILCWAILILFNEQIFERKLNLFMLLLHVVVLLTTLSTSMLILPISYLFVYQKKIVNYFRKKIGPILVLTSIAMISISYYFHSDWEEYEVYFDIFSYAFFGKIYEFLSPTIDTLGSGSFRKYTNQIGLDIFRDNFLFGVGAGNSYLYMWKYEFTQGVIAFGQMLDHSTPPQGGHTKILAEYGIIGYITYLLLIFELLRVTYRKDNFKINSRNTLRVGVVLNFIYFFSIMPEYSLFIWALPFLFYAHLISFKEVKNI